MTQEAFRQLIQELIQHGRRATVEEVEHVRRRIASAPFDQRIIMVPARYRGLTYQGRLLGDREDSLFLHLVQRVVGDRQWANDTTEYEYLEDLRTAVQEPSARLLVYQRRGGPVAAALSPNTDPV